MMSTPTTSPNEPHPAVGALNSLDLKCALVGAGVRYPQELYDAVAGWARLSLQATPTPVTASSFQARWQSISTPIRILVSRLACKTQNPCCSRIGTPVAAVTFPAATGYYQRKTTAGHPFGSIAVLEGRSTLAFFYLWSCDYVKTRETCSFCFQVMADMAGYNLPSPSNAEVAEVIQWAIENAGVQEVQLTAGTLFGSQTECRRYAEAAADDCPDGGPEKIKSEIYCYITGSKEPGRR